MAWREEIWLKIGQSNSVGSNGVGGAEDVYPETLDAEHPRVFEMSRNVSTIGYPAVPQGELIPHRAQAQDNSNYGVGFAQIFGKTRANNIPGLRKIIIINAGVGATSFSGGHWVAGQSLALIAHDLLVEAMTNFPDAVFAGILWHQGENDIDQTQEWYEGQLSTMVDYMRSGADSVDPDRNIGVFLCGTMLEYYIDLAGTRLRPIDDAHRNITNYVEKSALVDFVDLTGRRDTVHFNSQSLREMGARYAAEAFSMPALIGAGKSDTVYGALSCMMTDTVTLKRSSGTPSVDKYGDRIFEDESIEIKCRINHNISNDSLGISGNQSRMPNNERTTRVRLFTNEKVELGDMILLGADDTDGFTAQNVKYMKSPNSCIEYYMVELS